MHPHFMNVYVSIYLPMCLTLTCTLNYVHTEHDHGFCRNVPCTFIPREQNGIFPRAIVERLCLLRFFSLLPFRRSHWEGSPLFPSLPQYSSFFSTPSLPSLYHPSLSSDWHFIRHVEVPSLDLFDVTGVHSIFINLSAPPCIAPLH